MKRKVILFSSILFCVSFSYAKTDSLENYKNISVAAEGKALHLAWVENRSGKQNIYYIKSEDEGKTWTKEINLTPVRRHLCYPPALSVHAGILHLVWVDFGENRNGEIRYMRSKNKGNTWEREIILVDEADEAKIISIAVDRDNVYLAWQNIVGKIFFKASYNQGETWSKEIYIGRKSKEKYDTYPPVIFVNGKKISCIWDSIREDKPGFRAYIDVIPVVKGNVDIISTIDCRTSGDYGKTWEKKMDTFVKVVQSRKVSEEISDPLMLTGEKNSYLFWIQNRNEEYNLFYKRTSGSPKTWEEEENLEEESQNIFDYAAAAAGNDLHVVWLRFRKKNTSICYRRGIDNGDNWTQQSVLASKENEGRYSCPVICVAESGRLNVFYSDIPADKTTEIKYKYSLDGGAAWIDGKTE